MSDLVLLANTCDDLTIKKFKAIVDGLAFFMTDVTLSITPDGISICQMDTSRVMMVDIMFHREAFSQYDCTRNETICLDADALKRSMGTVKKRLQIEVRMDEKGAGRFMVSAWSEFRHVEELVLLEPCAKKRERPVMEFEVGVLVSGRVLRTILLTASKVVDNNLHVDVPEPTTMLIHGDSIDGDSYSAVLGSEMNDCVFSGLYFNKDARTTYSIAYLKEMRRFIVDNEDVLIEFSTDRPVKLSTRGHDIDMKLHLAPRKERRT